MKIIDTLEALEKEVLTAVSAIINRHNDNIVLVENTVLVENIVILGVVVLHDRTLLRCSVEGILVTIAIQINGVDSILSMKITTTSGSYVSRVIEDIDPTICQDFLHKYDLKKNNSTTITTTPISKHVVQQEVVVSYSIYFTREELVALHSIASNSEASQLRTIILDMCKQTIGEDSTESECNKLLTKFK